MDVNTLKLYPAHNVLPAAAPLRPQDRVVIHDGHFYTVGNPATAEEGNRIRFFGVSLALSANFPNKEDGEALAQQLAALGVNVVRLHALDQPAQQDPAGPVGVLVDSAQPQLDSRAIQTLSCFIEQLGRHGIYVDLNLFANHTFPPTQIGDRIPAQSHPLPIFVPDMMAWQESYAKSLLSALHLRDRPNLALVEINNESTLIDAWQEGALPTLVTGRFREALNDQWLAYRDEHYHNKRSLPLSPSGLSVNDSRDAARFFIELDKRYIDRMTRAVRSVLDEDVPVSGTQIIHSGRWNHGGFANLDVNRAATFTDAHFYVDHYFFPHRPWDWTDWRISNSWLGDSNAEALQNMAFARAAQRPFVISEFNQAWPNEQSSDLLPTVTQFAISQDWDGLILYDYAHDRNWSAATPSDFSLRGDLTKRIQFAQCAAYFRSLLPDTPFAQLKISLSSDARINAAVNGIRGNLARYLLKYLGIEPTLAMHHQVAMVDGTSVGLQKVATGRTSSYFAYDPALRQFTFGSAYAAGVSGYLSVGHPVKSSMLGVSLAPASRGFATAFLTTLDLKPLATSDHLLLTIPGTTMGTDTKGPQRLQATDPLGPWQTIFPGKGSAPSASLFEVPGPTQMERVVATVSIEIGAKRATVTALDISGKPLRSIDVSVVDGRIAFDVNRTQQPFAASYDVVVQR
jgi:hypothetical protein